MRCWRSGSSCSATGARQRPGLVRVAAIGLGVSATATWFLRTVSTRVQRRFRDKVTIALESHVARLQASVATIAHHERPDYLDRLAMLRDQVFVLDHMYMSVFSTCGWILRLGVTVALLVSIHPALVLLAVFALPTVLTSTWRPAVERAAQERGAPSNRLARHLFTLATTAPPGKEVRVTGIGERLDRAAPRRHGNAGTRRCRRPAGARRCGTPRRGRSSAARTSARSSSWRSGSRRRAGDVLLVLAAGSRLSAYIGATVGEIGFLRGIWMDGSQRLAWLEDYAASLAATADLPVPTSCATASGSITSRSPTPARRASCSTMCRSRCPPGRSSPSSARTAPARRRWSSCWRRCTSRRQGASSSDDTPLARVPADEWRARLAGAFQDFFRFEFRGAPHRRPRRRAAHGRSSRRSPPRSIAPAQTMSCRA